MNQIILDIASVLSRTSESHYLTRLRRALLTLLLCTRLRLPVTEITDIDIVSDINNVIYTLLYASG